MELLLHYPVINYGHIYKAIDNKPADIQKVQYCNHAPTKSVIKPKSQWM